MTDAKFTAGPLKAKGHSIYNGGKLIATVHLPFAIDEPRLDGESWVEMMERTKPEREARDIEGDANAHLIAAAPELYEALARGLRLLSVAVAQAGGNPETHDCCVEMRAALAKARGES
ncbi:MAG: hypothetical protein ACPG4X_15965 [Pikeienuella sp.]